MKDSKLIELYKTFNAIEKRRFAEYVASPFFNSNEHVIKLNHYIYEMIETNKSEELNKKNAAHYVFGKTKVDEQKLSDVMTFLMRLLESFVAQLKYEKKKLLQKEFLLTELRERNLDKHFISNTNEYRKKLTEKKVFDSDYFFENYVLERELDHYFIKKEVRKSNESLQNKADSLDIYYLSEKLKNLCDMVNRKNIIAADYDLKMLNELLEYIKKNNKAFQSIPAVYVYYKILLGLLESENPQHFKDLKHSLDKYVKQFSTEEARQVYDYAQNYCIKKVNSGHWEYLNELFSIYESLLKNEIIFEGKYLSQWDYKNIVSIALRLEKFDWTHQFIEKYKVRIATEFRENAYEYNLASYYYSKQDYKNALKLLQRVEFTDVFYHLGAKSMLLKIYYELDEVEPFYSLIDAFKVYLVRNKNISVTQRIVHQNLIKYTKKSFDLKLKGPVPSKIAYEKSVMKLKEQISAEKNITNLQWLLERVEELDS